MEHQINRTRPKRLNFDRPKKELLDLLPALTARQKTHKHAIFLPKATKLSSRAFTLKGSAPLICQDMLAFLTFIVSLYIYYFLPHFGV